VYNYPWAGLASGTTAPANLAVVISWQIGRRYRGGHPRTYLPGPITEYTLDHVHWSQPTVDSFTTNAGSYLGRINGIVVATFGPFRLVCVHYKHAHAALIPPAVDNVLSGRCNPLIGTMRRRLT
jgi:hypothetical protein